MDLHAAQMLNGKTWIWAKLAAVFFFAIAGALLIASLTTLHGSSAKAAHATKGKLELSTTTHSSALPAPAKRY
jgi:hypothetical protein